MPSGLHQVVTSHTVHVCVFSHIDVFVYICSPLPTDGHAAPDLCFKKVNEAGDMYGNCGKDLFGKYRSCKDR